MSTDQEWDGMAGSVPTPYAVVITWTCCGHTLGQSDLRLDTDDIAVRVEPFGQLVSYEGQEALNLRCDLCPSDTVISESSMRLLLTPLRAAYLAGSGPLVTELDVRIVGRLAGRA